VVVNSHSVHDSSSGSTHTDHLTRPEDAEVNATDGENATPGETVNATTTFDTTATSETTSGDTTTNSETTIADNAGGPIIEPFGEPLIGGDGKEITIDSASRDSAQTTLAIRYAAGDEAIETYNILTPTLNYGPDGTTAELAQLPNVSGVIVPGQSKVVSYTFDVAASELSEATLTVSIGLGSASWNGDLEAYISEIAP